MSSPNNMACSETSLSEDYWEKIKRRYKMLGDTDIGKNDLREQDAEDRTLWSYSGSQTNPGHNPPWT